jgi:hypothetical protein
MHTLRLALPALLPLTLSARALANEVTLEPIRDNTLIQQSSGTLSNGAGDGLYTGITNLGGIRRALLAFDVAGNLPAGTTINSVTLRLTVTQTATGPQSVDVHRASAAWGEGTSVGQGQGGGAGAPATPGDATWIHTFYPSAFWAAPGGDFVAAPSLTTIIDVSGPYDLSGPGLVADVQDMLDNPQNDHGWLIKHTTEVGQQTAKRFGSRESAFPSDRPQLIIAYGPPRCDASNYCNANPNSTGLAGVITTNGDCDVVTNSTSLSATQLPPHQFGYFLNSRAPAAVPVSQGILCVGGGQIGRYNNQVFNSGAAGAGSILLDLANTPTPNGTVAVLSGETWYFQCWFRDANPGPVSNFTDAVEVTFD